MLELENEKVKIEKERLEGLSKLGVDVTKVLVAECHVPDRSYKIESVSGQSARVHLHEEVAPRK